MAHWFSQQQVETRHLPRSGLVPWGHMAVMGGVSGYLGGPPPWQAGPWGSGQHDHLHQDLWVPAQAHHPHPATLLCVQAPHSPSGWLEPTRPLISHRSLLLPFRWPPLSLSNCPPPLHTPLSIQKTPLGQASSSWHDPLPSHFQPVLPHCAFGPQTHQPKSPPGPSPGPAVPTAGMLLPGPCLASALLPAVPAPGPLRPHIPPPQHSPRGVQARLGLPRAATVSCLMCLRCLASACPGGWGVARKH